MRTKSFLSTIGTQIVLILFFAIPVSAQNYIVNSNLDAPAANLVTGETAVPGQITLRSALQAATAQPGTHIITFSGAVVSPINLTLGQITVGNATNLSTDIRIIGPGMAALTVNQTTANRIFITPAGATGAGISFLLQDITLNYSGPATPYSGGGGAILTGAANAATTLINVTISNFNQQIGNGGAISASSSLNNHSLTITNCVFLNNRCGGAGGAVSYNSQGGTATITGSTFNNNHTGVVGANTGGDGGAVNLSGGGAGGTYLVERNTFINNQAENPGGHAGAIMSTNGTATIRFNRFIGNTCLNVANPPFANVIGQAGGATTHVTIADNNWWGVNTGPGTNDATALNAGAVMTLTKWLQLKTTASPNPICNTPAGLGNTTTVTTSFLSNSASEAIAVGNLTTVIGLPVTWGPTTLGSLSGQQGTIQANGTATATFTSNGTGGTATVNTQVDNVPAGETSPARANITVNTIPTVTAPANFTSCVGGTATFTSTITGTPAPTIVWRIGTTVLVNGLQASGSTVSGQGTATLTITNVQPGDAAVNYNVQASNHCGLATSSNATLFVNQVTGGTVGSDQTICSGGDPAAFTETVASTGSGVLTYQWQSSTTSCASGFSNIAGATSATYDPPSGLTVTTYYRRVTTSTLNAVPCTANSNCITVTINSVTGGTLSADQTICSGGDPAAFTETVASTGSGVLTYQWQSSTTSCASGFSNIAGATGTTYDPPSGLTVTTYYRRVTTSTLNAVPCTANSNCITVSVNDVTGGTVGSDQAVCSGGDPAAFTETVASTGSGVLTYQWQSSTTSCASGFSNIAGATSATYDPPSGLSVITYYRRITTSTLNAVPCTANSNCITVTINSVTGGTLSADQTICSGGDPAAFTETVASTGSGVLTYQWQSSTTSCASGFSNIAGATGTTYDPPSGLTVTTYYRRVTTSTLNAVPCTANSNCITVSVNDVTGGTVGSDQAVCSGGDPAAFTETVASTGSGVLTYQWQSSTTSCASGFSNIAGATSATYDPPSGLSVITYYRRITTSTLNAVPCTAISNCITVSITPDNTVTLTSAPGTDNQTVLVNTPITNITYATTGATGATVSGLPAGVSGSWAANVVTISGTPTAPGLFNYTVTLTGGCGTIQATGTINVIVCSVTLTSATGTNNQTVCNNSPITTITYATTGATGATVTGLPAGVTGTWSADVVTISGTPTVAGTFNYTVTPTGGGCTGIVTATGTITVNPIPDVNQPANQVVCNNGTTTTVNFTGSVPGTVYNWTNDNTSIGLAANGTGDIASFTAVNTGTTPVTATITVTPSYASLAVPEVLYYKFDGAGTSVPNLASAPPPGTANATIMGGITQGGTGICNGTLTGSGISASTDYLNTGWAPNLGTGSWTISFKSSGISTNSTLYYVFGDGNSNSFRCFTNGVAGSTNWILRGGGLTDTYINGGALNTPTTNTYVYDATLNQVRAYLNGTLVSTVAQSAPNVAGAGPFKVMGYNTNVGAPAGGMLDEFRVYNRALSPAEISALNNCFAGCTGTPQTFTITVNPTPTAVATPASQTICSGAITPIVLTGNVSGTTYNWTRDNTATVTGIAASGSGDISGNLINTTANPVTVTFTITPTANGCPGTPITATVLVNPVPTAVATPSSQTVCSGPITTIVLNGSVVTGTVYNWTRDNTINVTGIAASGSGDISGTLTNNTLVSQTVTFTITPTANGCPGTPITATVVVEAAPTITCPANITVNNSAGQCGNNVSYSTSVTGIPVPTVTYTFTGATTGSGSGNGSGSFFNVGTTNVIVTATNPCGTSSCSFTVTVNDVEPPVVTQGTISSCYPTVSAAEAAALAATSATDNCSGILTETASTTGTCSAVVTVTTTDVAGNSTVVTYNTRIDNTPPVITCPAPVTVSCASAVPAPNTASVIATDNCGGVVTVTHISDVISNQTCANRYTITRTYRATDVCGNFAQCTQIITVNDQTPPTLTCPAPVTVSCAAAVPAPNTAAVTGVSDNCGGVVTVTHISDVISNQTCANRYTITRTYRATDVCGNFAECTQIITVNDQTPPVITCPAPITVSCASAVPAPNIASVTATDNCAGPVTITHISDVISNQTCPNRFTLTRTYRATDVCGNFAECTQIITVNDQTAPVITCPSNITVTTPFGSCTAVVNFTVTATDNCGAVSVVSVPASGSAFPIGTTTVTSTATDACGNTATCTFTITVLDGQLPVITAQPQNRTVCAGQNATFSVTAITSPNANGPLNYQWQIWNGNAWTDISGATASTYTVNNATLSQNTNSYRVRVIGLCTTITSNHATLYVNPNPTVTLTTNIPPAILPTQSVTITAVPSIPGGTYQWYKNGVLIAGATNPTLGPLTVADIGTYRVVYTAPTGCTGTSADLAVTGLATPNLYVYPNPNRGQFTIQFYNQANEEVTVRVFDSKGAQVYQRKVLTTIPYTNIQIDLTNGRILTSGVYIVDVLDSGGRQIGTRRIIVYQ
jgi:hypothetical protein